ncbi:HAMP domain-containing sensor histidine kinase [Rhizobacter sp. SG703]|uniref:sensor histidine kinase n=1 Tax=Rhizobacter sp. SG703 TaxID=2587140 RepID=UPI001445EC67|nr:HAMP domain-containing sensor histidine kinase [Rhizobacter sp. SG703]NKI97578.1 signal transduction histidine kinase [Rhizobacter sp. SG703]
MPVTLHPCDVPVGLPFTKKLSTPSYSAAAALGRAASRVPMFGHHAATRAAANGRRARTTLARLRKVNEQLLQATLLSQRGQRQAELMLSRQTQMLAVVAHELRNPLMTLCTTATLLPRVAADNVPRLQEIIERQAGRMSRVISDLLDVSRINTGKLRLELCDVDIADVIEDSLVSCRHAMALRTQSLRLDMPSSPGGMRGDAVRLTQILSNLLGNASKYTPAGGDIALVVQRTPDAVAFTVSDNGIGITPQALLEVFDPFVQEQHALKFNGVGLGLGLAVVRELAEAHGGSVEASSGGLGLGSRFVVTIPVRDRRL